jgi:hypothetical protein
LPVLGVALPTGRAGFHTGLGMMAASLTLILYMAVYLPYCKRVTAEWTEYCPRVIYAATALGVGASIS